MSFRLEVHYRSGRVERSSYKTERERDVAMKAFAKLPTVLLVEKEGKRAR